MNIYVLPYTLSRSPFFFSFLLSGDPRDLHSFPTRRSSDLSPRSCGRQRIDAWTGRARCTPAPAAGRRCRRTPRDRKSTRLNSSHSSISYAVFCLKKKKKQRHNKIRSEAHYFVRSSHKDTIL